MTFEKVAKIIAENREIEQEKLSMETTFESLGFDSLDTVELAMSIEDEFGTAIEVSESLKTIADLVAIIDAAK